MQKTITLSLLLLACSFGFANSTITAKSVPDVKAISTTELVTITPVKMKLKTPFQIKIADLTSELPEAVLRLHDLKKVEYRGEVIYTHTPLEMSTLKSHIKTV